MPTEHRRIIGANLVADEAGLAEAFMTTIAREIPAYASLDERQLQEVRSIIVWTVRRVLELWAEDGMLTSDDLRLFRGVGAVRARDGRPLSAVLRAYRVAAGVFLEQISDRFRDDVSVEDVTSLVRVWFAVLDEVSEAIYDGYESTGRFLATDRESSLRGLLTDLLLGRQSHAGTLAARLRELDAQLPTSFDLVVAAPTAGLDADEVGALLTSAAEPGDGTLVTAIHATVDGLTVALLHRPDHGALAAVVEGNGLRATHERAVTARTAPRAHRLAAHAVRSAPQVAWSGGRLLDDGDLEVVALVTGQADADAGRTVAAVLGPLVDDADAWRTITAVLQSGGATQAAKHLHLHPQTVRYRLRRVTAATGRDPRDPWDRYVLQTATMAVRPSS